MAKIVVKRPSRATFQEETTSNILQGLPVKRHPRKSRRIMEDSPKLAADVTRQLRTLAHDLSNSLETILQASYLMEQLKLEGNAKKWAQLIDGAAKDAARVNREIRAILKSQSKE
jgi:signal transduction histidine kinase